MKISVPVTDHVLSAKSRKPQ